MAHYQILSWHGIPIGVKATDETESVREQLPPHFQVAVDAVATATGRIETTIYLAGWRWSEKVERAGSARQVAQAVAAELVRRFPPSELKTLRRELESSLQLRDAA